MDRHRCVEHTPTLAATHRLPTLAVPADWLAELPPSVTFAQAATLPVAGLTALRALEKGGFLLNRLSGAYVVGTVRQARHETIVREAGADEVIVGDDLAQAGAYGPCHLIIESLAGKALERALTLLAPGATCVTIGWSASPEGKATIDVRNFIVTGGTTLYTLEMSSEMRSDDLARLVQLVATQQLRTPIEVEASWHDIGAVAQRLWQRQFTGKAVLHLA